MNPRNLVSQSNDLIEARYIEPLSARQQKVVLAIVSMVSPDDEDFKPYVISVKDFSEMMGLQGYPKYSELRKLTRDMLKKVIEIPRGNGRTLQVIWFSSVEYFEGEGLIEFSFDPKLKAFLLNLKAYTQYRLSNVLALGSGYSIRLYELMKKWEKIVKIEYSIEQLREKLGAEGKYKQYGHFKDRIIKPSLKDINNKTDIAVEFKEKKTGRKVTKIEFTIRPNTHKAKETQPDFNKELFNELSQLAKFEISLTGFKKVEEIAKKIYQEEYINQLNLLVEIINLRIKQTNVENPMGLMIYIIEDKEELFNKGYNPRIEQTSKEVIPDWFKNRNKSNNLPEMSQEEADKKREEIERLLSKYRGE